MWIETIIGPLITVTIWGSLYVFMHVRIKRLEQRCTGLTRTVGILDLAVGGAPIRVEGGPMERMGMTHLPPIIRQAMHALELDYMCLPEIDLETGEPEMRNFQHYRKVKEGFFKYVGPCREVTGAKHMNPGEEQ